jgi:hypothetical protein
MYMKAWFDGFAEEHPSRIAEAQKMLRALAAVQKASR